MNNFGWIVLLIGCLSAGSGFSQEIIVGVVNQLKDPTSVGSQVTAGAKLCIDAVNDAGGVNGAKIKLVTRDRGADAVDGRGTVEVVTQLLREERPIALIAMTGTVPTEALLREKVLETAQVPLIGVRSGALSLHKPVPKWVFHTRANYAQELGKIAAHFTTTGRKRVALLYEDSPFGLEGQAQARSAIATQKLTLVEIATYEYASSNVQGAVERLAKAQPEGIIAIATSAALGEFQKRWREAGYQGFVAGISVADGSAIVKRIGTRAAHGLAIAQIVPDPASKSVLLSRQMQEDHAKYAPSLGLTSAVAEGYVAARVLVEGLKRAGAKPTPSRLRATLESSRSLDLGGFHVSYTPNNHSGSSFVDIAVIGPDGRMLR